jgi:hypothetical protein
MRRSALLFSAVLALTVLLGAGCDAIGERGSGNHRTETRDIDEFDSVRISRALRAEIQVVEGAQPSLEITFDDNLIDDVITEVRGRTLILEASRNMRPTSGHVIRVTTATLDDVTASGASRVEAEGALEASRIQINASGASRVSMTGPTAGNRVDVTASGASTVTLSGLDVSTVVLEASGASTLDLSGRADEIRIEVSGASSAQLEAVEATEAEVRLSGASRAHVRASDRVTGSASGASNVHVYGSPAVVDIDTSGASSVRAEN